MKYVLKEITKVGDNGCPRSVIGHVHIKGKDYAARLSVKGEFQIFNNGIKIWQGENKQAGKRRITSILGKVTGHKILP